MLHKKQFQISAICFFIGYYFDNMDGYYARRYNMVSKLGQIYDLVSDYVTHFILLFLFLKMKIKLRIKMLMILLLTIIFVLTLINTGCMEKYIKKIVY